MTLEFALEDSKYIACISATAIPDNTSIFKRFLVTLLVPGALSGLVDSRVCIRGLKLHRLHLYDHPSWQHSNFNRFLDTLPVLDALLGPVGSRLRI